MSVDGLKDDEETKEMGKIPMSPPHVDRTLQSKLPSKLDKGVNKSKKTKFFLSKTVCTATSEELGKLLIRVVLKPRAYLSEE